MNCQIIKSAEYTYNASNQIIHAIAMAYEGDQNRI